MKEDFEWYGIEYEGFKTRARMMEEGIRVVKECWKKGRADFEGEFFKLSRADPRPKAVQKPHPPIWVAGVSEEALKNRSQRGKRLVWVERNRA